MKNILLVDDHAMFRSSLKAALESADTSLLIEGIGSGEEALAALDHGNWHLVMLDLTLEGESGLHLLPCIQALHPSLPVLVVSMHDEEGLIQTVLQEGARGYVCKSEDTDTLLAAIGRVLAGGTHIGQPAASDLKRHATLLADNLPRLRLSARERQVLELSAQGLRPKEVAATMGISLSTVSTFRRRLFRKMGWKSEAEMFKALYLGPLPPT